MTIETYHFADDGATPNNDLPLLLYRDALPQADAHAAQEHFRQHNWTNAWVNGVYSYHHFHSTTHEVLGVVSGSAEVTFGGAEGDTFHVDAGDVVVIPAGVSHKRENASADFRVVGAYSNGRDWDLQRSGEADHAQMKANIEQVPRPPADPVEGDGGALLTHWT